MPNKDLDRLQDEASRLSSVQFRESRLPGRKDSDKQAWMEAAERGPSAERILPDAMAPDDAWYTDMVTHGVSQLIAEAHIKHRQDLPELLKTHHGEWAAYLGSKRLGIGPSETALYKKFMAQGIDANDLAVFDIAPGVFEADFEYHPPD